MAPKKKYSHKKTYNAAGEKHCSKCKDYKHISCFGKNMASNDAHMYVCTDCRMKGVKTKVVINTNIEIMSVLNAPILTSQVLYKYQRPDFYDLYISKSPTHF